MPTVSVALITKLPVSGYSLIQCNVKLCLPAIFFKPAPGVGKEPIDLGAGVGAGAGAGLGEVGGTTSGCNGLELFPSSGQTPK